MKVEVDVDVEWSEAQKNDTKMLNSILICCVILAISIFRLVNLSGERIRWQRDVKRHTEIKTGRDKTQREERCTQYEWL